MSLCWLDTRWHRDGATVRADHAILAHGFVVDFFAATDAHGVAELRCDFVDDKCRDGECSNKDGDGWQDGHAHDAKRGKSQTEHNPERPEAELVQIRDPLLYHQLFGPVPLVEHDNPRLPRVWGLHNYIVFG